MNEEIINLLQSVGEQGVRAVVICNIMDNLRTVSVASIVSVTVMLLLFAITYTMNESHL